MPVYLIEGKKVRSETPLSDAEIDEIGAEIRASQQAAPTVPTQEKPMGSVDTGDITSGFLMGIKDPITAGAQMLPRGLETLTSAGGMYPNVVSSFFASEAAKMDALAREEEQKYQASRAAQGGEGFDTSRLAGNILNPANIAVGVRGAQLLRGSPVLQAAGTGAAAGTLQPVTDMSEESFAAQKATQAGIGGVAGPVGMAGAQIIGRAASPLVTQAEKTMRELGITLTPGQMLGKQAKAIEEFAQNIPLIGSFISGARERQLFQFNKGIINRTLRKVDETLPDEVIGRDAVAYTQQVVGRKYDEVLDKITFDFDKSVASLLEKIIPASKIPSAAKKQELSDLINDLVYSQIPVDDTGRGIISGQAFKNIETAVNDKIGKYSRSTNPTDLDIADALSDMLKTLRNTLSSQNPKQAQQLKKINAAYADLTVMETAAANGGAKNGVFTPKNYQSAVRMRDQSRRKRAFAAGRARGQQVSDDAVEILSPEVASTVEGRVAMSLAGGYGALQNPAVAGAALIATPVIYSKGGLKALETIATKRPDIVRKMGEVFKKRSSREGSITAAEVMEEYRRQSGEMPFEGAR